MWRILASPMLMLMLTAAQADAGAWPREAGETFLSFSVETEEPDRYGRIRSFATLYAEHGLNARVTVGLDAGGDSARMSKAVLFLRLPLNAAESRTKIAAEFGLGRAADRPALRPALSLGRGFSLGGRHGWMASDTRLVLFDGAARRLVESDLTLGLNATDKAKLIFQIQTGFPDNGPWYMKLAPSLVLEPAPGRHIEFGLTAGVRELSALALKIGIWRRF